MSGLMQAFEERQMLRKITQEEETRRYDLSIEAAIGVFDRDYLELSHIQRQLSQDIEQALKASDLINRAGLHVLSIQDDTLQSELLALIKLTRASVLQMVEEAKERFYHQRHGLKHLDQAIAFRKKNRNLAIEQRVEKEMAQVDARAKERSNQPFKRSTSDRAKTAILSTISGGKIVPSEPDITLADVDNSKAVG